MTSLMKSSKERFALSAEAETGVVGKLIDAEVVVKRSLLMILQTCRTSDSPAACWDHIHPVFQRR